MNLQYEAAEDHSRELQALKAQSKETMDQVTASYQSQIDELKSEGLATLEEQVGSLEKTINSKNIELKATQDDLAKAKAAIAAATSESEVLKNQLAEAKASASNFASSASAQYAEEIQRLTKELSIARDDLDALNEVLAVTNSSLSHMSSKHSDELEESAKAHVQEILKLRASHEDEVAKLNSEKAALGARVSDLEGEMANLRASVAAAAELQGSQKRNGVAAAPEVTKEELQKLHEVHNLKMQDLQAEHAKSSQVIREDLELARAEAGELRGTVDTKDMEINFMQRDLDEKEDTIKGYVKQMKVYFFSRGPLFRIGRACAYLKSFAI